VGERLEAPGGVLPGRWTTQKFRDRQAFGCLGARGDSSGTAIVWNVILVYRGSVDRETPVYRDRGRFVSVVDRRFEIFDPMYSLHL